MPERHVIDAFKFVAVRPPQLAAPTAVGLMSDPRVAEGEVDLDNIIAPSDGDELSVRLAALAETSWRLIDHFAGQATDGAAAVPPELAQSLAPDQTGQLAGPAWDAIYAACRQGPGAGPQLETPLAALRLLHFASLKRDGAIQTVGDAAVALTAAALIPPQLTAVPPTEPARRRVSVRVAGHTDEPEHIRSLVEEISATRTLLNAVRSVNLKTKATIETQEPTMIAGHVRREQVRVGRMASLSPMLGAGLAPASLSVAAKLRVGESTSIPAATLAVQQHLSTLLYQADSLRSDPALRRIVSKLSHQLDVSDLVAIIPGSGVQDIFKPQPIPRDPGTAPDVDVSGRIKPLGIGDLKVVKQTLLGYQPGEVAHIENVLKGEHKERVHRTLDRTETTIFEATEDVTETERDNQSTERFELKKEADRTIKEDMSVQAGVTVTAAFGPVVTTAHGDFAYSTSKQESQRSSSNFAREVVERSVSKIQKKVKMERTTKIFRETEETNTHGIDNKGGPGHSVGVYRWVDKKYRAQVYNYGRRLMLEFIVPQPAAFWLASQKRQPVKVDATPPEPFVNAAGKTLTANDLDENNYLIYASRWNAAGVAPPPAEWTYASTSFEQSGVDNGKTISKALKDLVVPDGYTLIYYIAWVALVYVVGGPRFVIAIGEDAHVLVTSDAAKQGSATLLGSLPAAEEWDNPQGPVAVSIVGYDVNAYSVNIGANCKRNRRHFEDWQLKAFEKISAGYQAMKTAYDQKIAQAEAQVLGIQIQGRNPAQNRELEQRELKKLCVMMMSGSHLGDFNAMTDPADAPEHHPEIDVLEGLSEGPVIQFFEQAFDWQQMTYLFYPYFWGRKKQWVESVHRSDIDPLFTQFVQAGAARVVVPVSTSYNQAVSYFLSKKSPNLLDRIWLGGEPPTINDPLYRSIADEVRAQTDDLAGAKPEGAPWEFVVPTTLVWLQQGPELPSFPV